MKKKIIPFIHRFPSFFLVFGWISSVYGMTQIGNLGNIIGVDIGALIGVIGIIILSLVILNK